MDVSKNSEEQKLVYQNENITYQEAYTLNGTQVFSSEEMIDIIATVLNEIVQESDKIQNKTITNFHGQSVPSINLKDYLNRISRCAHCSQECFILGLIYIDRITQRHKNFTISSYNIHRLLITAIMLAAQFFDDRYYNNEYYSKVGGISNLEINMLEQQFLHYINFRLYVSPVLFYKYRERLIVSVEGDDSTEL